MREEHGEPDVIEVRQTFNDSLQAREWEEKVLRRIGAVKDERWLNLCRGGVDFYRVGLHSEETKKKLKFAWNNQELRMSRIASIQKAQRTEECRKHKSDAVKKTWKEASEKREKSRDKLAKRNKSKISRQISKETSIKNWKDDSFRHNRSLEKRGGLVVFDVVSQSFIRVSCEDYRENKNKTYFGVNSFYVRELKSHNPLSANKPKDPPT